MDSSTVIAFSRSMRGSSHIAADTPCEDSSATLSDPAGRWTIAAVADGHGSSSAPRAERGSALAIDAAKIELKALAESLLAEAEKRASAPLEVLAGKEDTVLRLIASKIAARWRKSVEADYDAAPPEGAAPSAELHAKLHCYGTTLIAALAVDTALVLFQQGDGACLVASADGFSRPVPPDERCIANVTTSLSDADAGERMRIAVVDAERILFCALTSDGFDDSFPYEAGAAKYLTDIAIEAAPAHAKDGNRGLADYLEHLDDHLSLISRDGSTDDVSLAALVSPSILQEAPNLLDTAEKAMLHEELQRSYRKLDTLTRNIGRSEPAGEHRMKLKRKLEHAEILHSYLEDRLIERGEDEGARQVLCPVCGKRAHTGDLFCTNCGQQLEGTHAMKEETADAQ